MKRDAEIVELAMTGRMEAIWDLEPELSQREYRLWKKAYDASPVVIERRAQEAAQQRARMEQRRQESLAAGRERREVWKQAIFQAVRTNTPVPESLRGSGRKRECCVVCHRPLSDPQSMWRGIGPDCLDNVLGEIAARDARLVA